MPIWLLANLIKSHFAQGGGASSGGASGANGGLFQAIAHALSRSAPNSTPPTDVSPGGGLSPSGSVYAPGQPGQSQSGGLLGYLQSLGNTLSNNPLADPNNNIGNTPHVGFWSQGSAYNGSPNIGALEGKGATKERAAA